MTPLEHHKKVAAERYGLRYPDGENWLFEDVSTNAKMQKGMSRRTEKPQNQRMKLVLRLFYYYSVM